MTGKAGVKLVQSDSENCPRRGELSSHQGWPACPPGGGGGHGTGPPPEKAAAQVGRESRPAQMGSCCPDWRPWGKEVRVPSLDEQCAQIASLHVSSAHMTVCPHTQGPGPPGVIKDAGHTHGPWSRSPLQPMTRVSAEHRPCLLGAVRAGVGHPLPSPAPAAHSPAGEMV